MARDLLAAPEATWRATRDRVATEGFGARLLALQDPTRGDARAFGLEEGIGIVPCVVETLADGTGGRARFRLPVLPPAGFPGVAIGQEIHLGS